jgi:hypothetical protein
MCVAKLGYTMSSTVKANSFEVRWGTHTTESKKIATIVFEPGIRHWVVQTNGRNIKFISNLTATHQALQTELGISSISGGTTIVSAPIMSSYQELLEFGFANLQLACPGIIITEQSATGKGINNSGYKAKCALTGGTVTITANHGVQSAPCFKIDGKAFPRQHVVATLINSLKKRASLPPQFALMNTSLGLLDETNAHPTFLTSATLQLASSPHLPASDPTPPATSSAMTAIANQMASDVFLEVAHATIAQKKKTRSPFSTSVSITSDQQPYLPLTWDANSACPPSLQSITPFGYAQTQNPFEPLS